MCTEGGPVDKTWSIKYGNKSGFSDKVGSFKLSEKNDRQQRKQNLALSGFGVPAQLTINMQ